MSKSFTLVGFDEMRTRLSPIAFKHKLEAMIAVAQSRNAAIARRAIAGSMGKSSKFHPLTAMTRSLKGGRNNPLLSSSILQSHIANFAPSWDMQYIGLLEDSQTYTGSGRSASLMAVAKRLHEGGVTHVTPKMRKFFQIMAGKTKGRVKALKPTTVLLLTPPRPFLEYGFTSELIQKYVKNYHRSVTATLNAKPSRKKTG